MFSNSQAYPTGMLQSKESVKSTSHVAHLKNYSRMLLQQQSWILSKKSNFYHVGRQSVSVCNVVVCCRDVWLVPCHHHCGCSLRRTQGASWLPGTEGLYC